MELTARNVWYHSRLYGVPSYFNGQTGEVISKSWTGDIALNVVFWINNLCYLLFDFIFVAEEGFKIVLINKAITDKDWERIQRISKYAEKL